MCKKVSLGYQVNVLSIKPTGTVRSDFPIPWEKIGGCLNSAGQLITGDKFPGTDCDQNLQLSLGIEEKSKKPDAPFLWRFRLLPK